jgi:hypothetical protein
MLKRRHTIIPGVYHRQDARIINNELYDRDEFEAHIWRDGTHFTRSFSSRKYGRDKARDLAIDARLNKKHKLLI